MPRKKTLKVGSRFTELNRARYKTTLKKSPQEIHRLIDAINKVVFTLRTKKGNFSRRKELFNEHAEELMQPLRSCKSHAEFLDESRKLISQIRDAIRLETEDSKLRKMMSEKYETEIMLIGFSLEIKKLRKELKRK
ncbi:MAG: hypothetical protein Q7S21_07825 [archaeon]|nr:hypothetical protein [archaeon]